jgi:hypothetical protein
MLGSGAQSKSLLFVSCILINLDSLIIAGLEIWVYTKIKDAIADKLYPSLLTKRKRLLIVKTVAILTVIATLQTIVGCMLGAGS